MSLPALLDGRLKVPAIAAPMFLVSGPALVVETCRAGVLGTFPALNQRTTDGYADWLETIAAELDGEAAAPFGVNLVVHRSNTRLEADLKATVDHKVPLVITSLGAVPEVIDAVQGYGGVVFHDVINPVHARKAAAMGVDGIIAVCAGAGGHAGTLSPLALLPEIRSFFDGTLILGGAISTGRQIAAVRMMGADLAYIGSRFIATEESLASAGQKAMMLDADMADIVYTPAISGVWGNFLRPSIVAAGRDPDDLLPPTQHDFGTDEAKVWKDIWSAGQGVGAIEDMPSAADLCHRLSSEYRSALQDAATW